MRVAVLRKHLGYWSMLPSGTAPRVRGRGEASHPGMAPRGPTGHCLQRSRLTCPLPEPRRGFLERLNGLYSGALLHQGGKPGLEPLVKALRPPLTCLVGRAPAPPFLPDRARSFEFLLKSPQCLTDRLSLTHQYPNAHEPASCTADAMPTKNCVCKAASSQFTIPRSSVLCATDLLG
jgi:hypothetical protein